MCQGSGRHKKIKTTTEELETSYQKGKGEAVPITKRDWKSRARPGQGGFGEEGLSKIEGGPPRRRGPEDSGSKGHRGSTKRKGDGDHETNNDKRRGWRSILKNFASKLAGLHRAVMKKRLIVKGRGRKEYKTLPPLVFGGILVYKPRPATMREQLRKQTKSVRKNSINV